MELMKQIDGVLFDLDGTLIDSFPDFLQSLKTLSIRGKETIITEKNVRALVSDGSSKLINEVFGISELDDDFFHLKKEFLSSLNKPNWTTISALVIIFSSSFEVNTPKSLYS